MIGLQTAKDFPGSFSFSSQGSFGGPQNLAVVPNQNAVVFRKLCGGPLKRVRFGRG